MATVDIAIPSRSGLRPDTWTSLVKLMRAANCQCRHHTTGAPLHAPWECNRGRHSIRWLPHPQSSIIHWARNAVVAQGLYEVSADGRPPAEYLLLVDDDMVFEEDALARLLVHGKDIVAGICTLRRDPPRPNVRIWDAKGEKFVEIIEWERDSQKLMEVDAVGAAFVLIKRQVFEGMAKAYLSCRFELEDDRRKFRSLDTAAQAALEAHWNRRAQLRREKFDAAQKRGDFKGMDCWWFEMLRNVSDRQVGELGEDISFCWKAKKLGFRIFADPQVLPGHLGEYGYSARDYFAYLDEARELGAIPVELPRVEPGLVPSSVNA